MATKREQAYALFDKGLVPTSPELKALGAKKSSLSTFYSEWQNMKEQPPQGAPKKPAGAPLVVSEKEAKQLVENLVPDKLPPEEKSHKPEKKTSILADFENPKLDIDTITLLYAAMKASVERFHCKEMSLNEWLKWYIPASMARFRIVLTTYIDLDEKPGGEPEGNGHEPQAFVPPGLVQIEESPETEEEQND